ncbi:MAG: GNAT family N-acetyltransferase [Anaerolineae bacterium]
MRIVRFDPASASNADWQALNSFWNMIDAEFWPEDPPVPVEKTILDYTNQPSFTTRYLYAAWDGDGQIVGSSEAWVPHTEDNQHLAYCDLNILPEWRGQGLGAQLLACLVEPARAEERRLLQFFVDGELNTTDIDLERVGKMGMEMRQNQLDIAKVDKHMLDMWIQRASERASDFSIGVWTGAYPEEEMPGLVHLFEAMNDAPRGELDWEDEVITPEILREWEQSAMKRGEERWTVAARDNATGELAGYSQIFMHPLRPTVAWQGATATLPKYRNRGLGRWMKAVMLEKVMRERPLIQCIRTGNADSNAPMLKINYELGFYHRKTWQIWQLEVDRAAEYTTESECVEQVA